MSKKFPTDWKKKGLLPPENLALHIEVVEAQDGTAKLDLWVGFDVEWAHFEAVVLEEGHSFNIVKVDTAEEESIEGELWEAELERIPRTKIDPASILDIASGLMGGKDDA